MSSLLLRLTNRRSREGTKDPKGLWRCVQNPGLKARRVQAPTLADLQQDQSLRLLGSDSSSLLWGVT